MKRSLRPTVFVALVLLAVPACSEEPEERVYKRQPRLLTEAPEIQPIPEAIEPSVLIGPYRSMMSLEEALAVSGDLPYETTNNHRADKRGACPGQHFLRLGVKRFWDFERKGTLFLELFDDMLVSIRFMTFDVDGYRAAFFAEHGLEPRPRRELAYVMPGTVISTPIMGNRGILVEDFRLRKWAHSVDLACRYEWQQERGWHSESDIPVEP